MSITIAKTEVTSIWVCQKSDKVLFCYCCIVNLSEHLTYVVNTGLLNCSDSELRCRLSNQCVPHSRKVKEKGCKLYQIILRCISEKGEWKRIVCHTENDSAVLQASKFADC